MPKIFVFDYSEASESELRSNGFTPHTYLVIVQRHMDIRKWESDILATREYEPLQFFASDCFEKIERCQLYTGVVMECAKPDRWWLSKAGLKEKTVYTKYVPKIPEAEQEVLTMKHVPLVWCVSSWWGKLA